MNHIISHLSRLTDSSEILYSITMQGILTTISYRMGQEALSLTADDLNHAKDNFVAALEHHLDVMPIYEIAYETWLIEKDL